MSAPPDSQPLRGLLYHELGHAVMASIEGADIVAISPDPDDDDPESYMTTALIVDHERIKNPSSVGEEGDQNPSSIGEEVIQNLTSVDILTGGPAFSLLFDNRFEKISDAMVFCAGSFIYREMLGDQGAGICSGSDNDLDLIDATSPGGLKGFKAVMKARYATAIGIALRNPIEQLVNEYAECALGSTFWIDAAPLRQHLAAHINFSNLGLLAGFIPLATNPEGAERVVNSIPLVSTDLREFMLAEEPELVPASASTSTMLTPTS